MLEHLLTCDPLGLRPLVTDRLRARALFLDVRSVEVETACDLALRGAEDGLSLVERERGRTRRRQQRLHLERAVDRAVDRLLEAAEEDGGTDERSTNVIAPFEWARSFGWSVEAITRGLARFHRQPLETRRLFRELVLERRPLRSLALELDRPAPDLLRDVRTVFLDCFELEAERLET